MKFCHGLTINVRGITLLEMLVTLAVAAILAAIAVPSFAAIQQNSQRRVAMDNFWHAIFLARSEAVKRNSVIAICKSADGITCNNAAGDWSAGWMVFDNLDHDEPAQRDDDEPVLQVYAPWHNGHVTSNRQTFSFRATTQGAVNGTIVFCDARGNADARAIIISHTGRPRQSQRDASNKPLICPAA